MVWEMAKESDPRTEPELLLKMLDKVRNQGLSIILDTVTNVRTIATPVWNGKRGVIGAVGVGGPATRFLAERASVITSRLVEVEAAISNHYGTTASRQQGSV